MTIVGARPQFIKAAAVSHALATDPLMEELMIHTGQHYDANMSDLFFDELGLAPPFLHLGIGSASHGTQTGMILAALEQPMVDEKPDWVLVYGDTNSTMAGALAAAKLQIPLAHVEAGLRSFNRRMPEEINRLVADQLSDLLFAPTESAVQNLAREGIVGDRVVKVGDVMYDVALLMAERARTRSVIHDRLQLRGDDYAVATIHRAENTDDANRLATILDAFAEIGRQIPIVLPLHPRTRARLAALGKRLPDVVITTEPLGYLDITALLTKARLVLTDSGGLQKEAFFHGVPCITLRNETEWVELVTLGWNRIVPPNRAEDIVEATRLTLAGPDPVRPAESPYGSGSSAELIVGALSLTASRQTEDVSPP